MQTKAVSTVGPSPTMDYLPAPDPQAVEQALLIGDISQMTDQQRIAYYVAVCRSLQLNALTRPFLAMKGDDGAVTLYPDKGCAEQLRKLHRVSITIVSRETIEDLYIVTVRATTPDGREEESQGIVPLSKPKGRWEDYEYQGQKRGRFKPDVDSHGQEMTVPLSASDRALAMMRAESKAKRRATLALCGLGLAEWDAEPTRASHPLALTLQAAPPAGAGAPSPAEQRQGLQEHISDLCGDPPEPGPPVPQERSTPPDRGGERGDPTPLILAPPGGPPAAQAPSPIWATIEGWYTAAGRAEHFAGFQAWCLRRYAVRDLTQIPEADLEELARRAYATLEPLIVQRQAPGAARQDAPPVGGDWRARLAALLPAVQEAALARAAQRVLEDPDTTEAQGRDLLDRVVWAVEGQDEGPDEQGAPHVQ